MIDFEKLTMAMGDLDEGAVRDKVRRVAENAPEQVSTALAALSRGMDIIGKKFAACEYFIADLIFAGELFTEAIELLRPAFPPEEEPTGQTVVLATVEGDLHDIGKNIVRVVLQSKGMRVIDLGVNASPCLIARRAAEENADVVALSAVLTYAVESMERTVKALKSIGIRDKVTVVVGGACMDEHIARKIGADAYGRTPEDTAAICLAVANKED